ncbi:MAG TPA: hypothetical protein DHV62_05515 [Elusimicrobia bacterium]|jgi:two-component system chemotaxis response regulator CheB|nr:hypothetical protein [Elusimicrobiota bacterium]
MKKIRILIFDDNLTGQENLKKVFFADREIEIVGFFPNKPWAREKVFSLKPDLVALDLSNSFTEGLNTIEYIMAHSPRPIIGLTLPGCRKEYLQGNHLFKAIELGALEIMEKPNHYLPEQWIKEIKAISQAKVITHLRGRLKRKLPSEEIKDISPEGRIFSGGFVAFAGSTGGPQAIRSILNSISPEFPLPIGIVQHLPEGFVKDFVDWLNSESWIKVKEAEDGEPLKADIAYLAPAGKHMLIGENKKIKLETQSSKSNYFVCPSADIFFSSVAKVYGSEAIGVILSGMGNDGKEGLKAIKDAGGKTISQDEKSSLIFGMPKAAIDFGAVNKILPLDSIPQEIIRMITEI